MAYEIFSFFEKALLIYAIIVLSSYLIQAIASSIVVKSYLNKKKFSDESSLLKSQYLPKIALLAPAYNESAVIIESVRSLLTVQYFNLELVIINDGSKDDTLQKLIEGFDLVEHKQRSYHKLATQPVRATYRSKNDAFRHLLVIDKENGRKADAINVGINHAHADYFAVIDLDCILEPNALLMMIEPVLKSKTKKVVAVGGVIGATNDSQIKHGKFIKAKAPKRFLPRIQILEYIRAFIFGRPAWSSINGLLIISGALGLFEKQTLLAVGGYSHNSIGEDMDLVMKMHKYCREQKIDYKVEYVPFPLCWTEVPEDKKILASQRNRWMRGTIECMWRYKKMFLNPKYGIIGMISYPYWLIAEMLAPIIEFLGLVFLLLFTILGIVNWPHALLLFTLVYLLSITHSFFALLEYYISFRKYNTTKDILQLFKTALLEPFIYHPLSFSWSFRGYIDFFTNKNLGWGQMRRVGFNKLETTSIEAKP